MQQKDVLYFYCLFIILWLEKYLTKVLLPRVCLGQWFRSKFMSLFERFIKITVSNESFNCPTLYDLCKRAIKRDLVCYSIISWLSACFSSHVILQMRNLTKKWFPLPWQVYSAGNREKTCLMMSGWSFGWKSSNFLNYESFWENVAQRIGFAELESAFLAREITDACLHALMNAWQSHEGIYPPPACDRPFLSRLSLSLAGFSAAGVFRDTPDSS